MDAPKLMSYNQLDFQSKANLEMHVRQLESETDMYKEQLEKAGMLSFTLTQVWNKQGKHRLGLYFSYRDEKAFIDCQKILNGIRVKNFYLVLKKLLNGMLTIKNFLIKM